MKLVMPAFIVLLAGIPANAQATKGDHNTFVVRNVRIFDGRRVIPQGDVFVENGMIRAVGSNLRTPKDLPAIDGRGRTLLPGLIDGHVHTMGEAEFLRSALALGVTTELDMGAAPQFADRIEREQAEGKYLDLADLRSSRTQPTAPDGHGTEYGLRIPTVSSPEEARAVVDSLVAEGADFIGEIVYDDGSEYGLHIPTLSRENLRAVIDAAHGHGKLAVVHVLSLQGAKDAIAAGADGLVHLFADRPADDEFIALARQHHPFVMPTLSLLGSMAGASAGPVLAADPRLEPYLNSTAIADLGTSLPRPVGTYRYAQDAVRRLRAARIPILAGTDAHNAGTAHGASLLSELQLLVNTGMTPSEALESATSVNASSFGLEDRGEILPGKRADLLLVDGDPTSSIADIFNTVGVWKLGVPVDREGYRATLGKEKDAERLARQAAPPAGSVSGLISDFEDGTTSAKFGMGWHPSAGRLLGGPCPVAEILVADSGAIGSKKALRIAGEIKPGVFGWAGAMFVPGSVPMAPVNLSGKKTICFWTRGDGRTYQVMLLSKRRGSMPVMRSFTSGSGWSKIVMPISAFGTDASDLQGLIFAGVALPGHFAFVIDDVRLED